MRHHGRQHGPEALRMENLAEDAERCTEKDQRHQGAKAGRGQAGEDRNGVDETFVKNTQHDIDDKNRQHDQQPQAGERRLELERLTLERGADRGRKRFVGQVLHFLQGVAQRHTGAQAKGKRHGRELAVVVHGERPQALVDARDGVQGHELAAGRADIQHRKRIRVHLILRFELRHHPILVLGRVDGGHLPLAVGGGQSVLHLKR